jgi:hypothetical protein
MLQTVLASGAGFWGFTVCLATAVAVLHPDATRRVDARKVLDQLLGIALAKARTNRRRARDR